MPTSITRNDLASLQGMTPKLLRALEELFVGVADVTDTVEGQTAATGAIQNATVVTLSPNAAFNNERVLKPGVGITLTTTATDVTISTADQITTNGGYRLTFNLFSDVNLDLPSTGTVATTNLGGETYADDAAAATGGVEIGEIYRKVGGIVAWRVV